MSMMMQDEQPMEEQAEDEMEVRFPGKTTKMMAAASFDQISFSTIGASLAVIQLDRSIQIVWLT